MVDVADIRGEGGSESLVLTAWDTCTTRGVVALASGGELLSETYFQTVKGHSGWLMPLVEMTLDTVGLAPGDIDCVATGIGPGTFTGVKVGVVTAKSVALACDVPLVGVSTLDILAVGAPEGADLVLSTVDARRGMLYAAAYRTVGNDAGRVSPYICETPERVAEMARSLGYESVAVVGESPDLLVRPLKEGGELRVADDPFPGARGIINASAGLISRGRMGRAASVDPIYLKKPV